MVIRYTRNVDPEEVPPQGGPVIDWNNLDVKSSDTVEVVKQLIEKKEGPGFSICRQILTYGGKDLENGHTLASYGIKMEAILYLKLRDSNRATHIKVEVETGGQLKLSKPTSFIVKTGYCTGCHQEPVISQPSEYVKVQTYGRAIQGKYELKSNDSEKRYPADWIYSALTFYPDEPFTPGDVIDVRVDRSKLHPMYKDEQPTVTSFRMPEPVTLKVKLNGLIQHQLTLARSTLDLLSELRTAIVAITGVSLDQIGLIQRISKRWRPDSVNEAHPGPNNPQTIKSSVAINCCIADGDTLLVSLTELPDNDAQDLTRATTTREDVLGERLIQVKQEKLDVEESKMEIEANYERAACELASTKRKAESDLQQSTKRVKQVESELESEKDQRICIACSTEKRSLIYLPCAHILCCQACDAKLLVRRCPTCRAVIKEQKVVFF